MDNFGQQLVGEAGKLVTNVAKDTLTGGLETLVGIPTSPFAQSPGEDKQDDKEDPLTLKKLQDQRRARARLSQLRQELEQVQKAKEAQKAKEQRTEQAQEQEMRKSKRQRLKEMFLSRAKQGGGTGEVRNKGF